ncbi:tau 95 subunit of transcription factor TFIIIC [Curvularia kusanoi]|uniref:Cytochrome c oxidase subunit 6, mitochondrial n=1 Tax=Curvularia kusanoi TaxID=90978 RepID=A0A9P4WE77_CURKU|nr:tau 95 subunit of transcription factor TFIIIC [Curvularia kusanoi]
MDNNNRSDVSSAASASTELAPWLPIPSCAVSAIEHPCIIKNVDKGITSLGGPVKLSKSLRSNLKTNTNARSDDELKKLISVSLRPNDPFAKRLLATPVTTNNLLLKITVPRRTGRKRKRGTAGPFVSDHQPEDAEQNYVEAADIYRMLQDNASRYKVAFAGVIDETHRFRAMPDLQYAASQNDVMVGLRDYVLPARYADLKQYNINTAAGADLTKSVGPSAEFMQMPIAFNYKFQQNAYVKYTDQGEVNLQRRFRYNSYIILKPTDEVVPTQPKPTLQPESSLTPYLQALINQIKNLLKERPIITRHRLYNKLGWDKRTRLRQAAVYCGYFFESGPWREALIAWGVDPRTDPYYRKFQTVSFLSYKKRGTVRHHDAFDKHVRELSQMTADELEHQHTFDGIHASDTGSTFQFCDITDPLLAKILATDDIRTTCAPTFQGWYHVGTWAKVTVILKDKMNTIIDGELPDNTLYQRVCQWPELWDDKEIFSSYKDEFHNREVREARRREHELMGSVRIAARNPRYAFEQMEKDDTSSTHKDPAPALTDEVEIPEDLTEYPDDPDNAEATLNEVAETMESSDGEDDDDDEEDEDEDEIGDGDDDDEDEENVVGVELLASGTPVNTRATLPRRSGHCKNLESDAPTSQNDLRITTDHTTMSFVRATSKISRAAVRAPVYRSTPVAWNAQRAFSQSAVRSSDAHAEETFEEFTARYEKEFEKVNDVFELQRNLNNCFAYDLVPSPSVITAALQAARRVNDFPSAVRVFEGIKFKVENKNQYEEYLQELEPIREELGIPLKEAMYPDEK